MPKVHLNITTLEIESLPVIKVLAKRNRESDSICFGLQTSWSSFGLNGLAIY